MHKLGLKKFKWYFSQAGSLYNSMQYEKSVDKSLWSEAELRLNSRLWLSRRVNIHSVSILI